MARYLSESIGGEILDFGDSRDSFGEEIQDRIDTVCGTIRFHLLINPAVRGMPTKLIPAKAKAEVLKGMLDINRPTD